MNVCKLDFKLEKQQNGNLKPNEACIVWNVANSIMSPVFC